MSRNLSLTGTGLISCGSCKCFATARIEAHRRLRNCERNFLREFTARTSHKACPPKNSGPRMASMQTALAALVRYINEISLAKDYIIPWSCPVLSFGNPLTASVATLGLNPSNREFVDEAGNELDGPFRRFQ